MRAFVDRGEPSFIFGVVASGLGWTLTTFVEERAVGILLVEHDMALVMAVCQ